MFHGLRVSKSELDVESPLRTTLARHYDNEAITIRRTRMMTNTRARVHEVADQLAGEGLQVTVRSIRGRLGRGSDTTIAAALRDWRSAAAARTTTNAGLGATLLPPALARESEILYLRILAVVSERFSSERDTVARAIAGAGAHALEASRDIGRMSNLAVAVSRDLVVAAEERAALAVRLAEKELVMAELIATADALRVQVETLTQELTETKIAAAERETLAYARAEGLSRHLMQMTDEQRTQLGAPMAALKERYEGLVQREGIREQQMNALRAENNQLKGRLDEREKS